MPMSAHRVAALAGPALALTCAACAGAATIPPSNFSVDPRITDYDLEEGTLLDAMPVGDPGRFDLLRGTQGAYDDPADSADWSGSFSGQLSEIGAVGGYFEFGLDIWEPNANNGSRRLDLSDIAFEVDGQTVWQLSAGVAAFDNPIVFNEKRCPYPDCFTSSYAGAGVDAVLRIPVALVVALSEQTGDVYTGGSSYSFKWSQAQGSDAAERWFVDSDTGFHFGTDDRIVPLPAAAPMLAASLAAFALLRRRRRARA